MLYLGALAIGLITTLLTWNQTIALMQVDPSTAAVATPIMIGSLVIGFGISLLLWFLVSRMRSTIAKWVLTVFFVIGVLSVLFTFANGTFPPGLAGVLSIVSTVLQGVAVYMLFRPDAVAWFRGEPTGDVSAPFE